MLGLAPADLIEIPMSGNAGGGAAARVTGTGRLDEVIHSERDAECEIAATLAGSAAMRALGLDDAGGEADRETAARIAVWFTGEADAALELHERAEARTEALVATRRFQDLLLDLLPALIAVPAMTGRRAEELLEGWDPEAPMSGVRGMTYEQFAAAHPSPWSARKIAARGPIETADAWASRPRGVMPPAELRARVRPGQIIRGGGGRWEIVDP
jgi:hypothetical protein